MTYKITATPQEIVEAINNSGKAILTPFTEAILLEALSTLPRHDEREPSPAPEALVERLVHSIKNHPEIGLWDVESENELLYGIRINDLTSAIRTALENVEDELVETVKLVAINQKQISGEVVLSDLTISKLRTAIRSVLKGGGS